MNITATLAETDAIAGNLAGLADELRTTIGNVDDPQAKAMLETGAEVLGSCGRPLSTTRTATRKLGSGSRAGQSARSAGQPELRRRSRPVGE